MADALLFDDSNLPPELDARVRAELERGEQLLWVGQPLPGRFARGGWALVLFGIPWTAFALFWMATAGGFAFFAGKAPGGPPGGPFWGLFACFPLFGLPFVLIGIGMLSSPYWLRQKAKRTCYALTDRRAIVWNAGWFRSAEVRGYGPGQLTHLRRVEYPDGCGDLIFEEVVSFGRDGDGDTTRNTARYGFMAIRRVHEVEELLRKALLSGGNKEQA